MVQSSGNEAQWTKVQPLFCLGTPTSLLPSSVLLPFFLLLASPLSALPPQPLPYPSLSSLSIPQPVIQQDALLSSCKPGAGRQAGMM